MNSEELMIYFPEIGVAMNIPCTKVGDTRYRIDGIPLGIESPTHDDIIDIKRSGDCFEILEIVQRSGWTAITLQLSDARRSSIDLDILLEEVTKLGGIWERLFGGLLSVALPPNIDKSVLSRLEHFS